MRATCRALGGLLTSGVRRRRPSTSRLGRDVDQRRVLNRSAFLKNRGRTELSQALLDQGELLQGSSGQFEVLEVRGACSYREDAVWSGGNAEGSPVFVFFMKVEPVHLSRSRSVLLTSVVVRRLIRNASLVGYPRFFVSQARVSIVLGVFPGTCVVPLRSVSSVLDTLTPVFELYVRRRERWQWDIGFPELVFSRLVLRPETLEVPGMDLRLCVCRRMWFGRAVLRGGRVMGPSTCGVSPFFRGVRRVLNATALVVTFLLPPLSGDVCMHATCRAFGGLLTSELSQALLDQGELLRGSSRRFEVLEVCSLREDAVWSGGNAEGSPVSAFFVKVEPVHLSRSRSVLLTSVVVRRLIRNASLVGYPRFFVSQARVSVVLGVCPGTCVVPSRSVLSVLDTLTSVFELYVRLRERRQWDNDFPELIFTRLVLRPETLEVPGMDLQLCVCRLDTDLISQ
ncbi:hypothetical protein Taro_029648 [Colocasia esculenta]|uniref:Uncharacterized protein n=1 Tax=Colocasia esculenta TaxID=4460 RepID=A0A843W0W9_COLES|nr:hypothetical protein [Colocasia esculenta]